MARKNVFGVGRAAMFIWMTVALLAFVALGAGMISGALIIPFIPSIVTIVAGWILIVGSILGYITTLFT